MAIGIASLVGVAFAWRFPFRGRNQTASQSQEASGTPAPQTAIPSNISDGSAAPSDTSDITLDPEGSANNPPPPPTPSETIAQADNPPPPPKTSNSEEVPLDPEGSGNQNSPVPALW